eukprot:2683726-Alexandrium_andersonii.AAC.1
MQLRTRSRPRLRVELRRRRVPERAPEGRLLGVRPERRTAPTPTEGLVLEGADALAELRHPLAEGDSTKLADGPRNLPLLLLLDTVGVAEGPRA